MPASQSSAIEGIASKPLSSRGRANGGDKAPAAPRGRKAPVEAAGAVPASAPVADAAEPVVKAVVGRGRPKGSVNKAPREPRAPRAASAPAGGFSTRDIEVSVKAKISDAQKAKRTLEAEFKKEDRELTSAMNAAIKAQGAAQDKHDKAIKGLDEQIAAGEALLARLVG